MTTGSTCLRGVWIAAAALLVLTITVTGCGRPADEAWLRCLGFQQSAETISVLEGDLNDATSSTVDVALENSSFGAGRTTGTGILVTRTRIDYRMSGYAPPSADYPVNLYLAPPADSAPTTGTLTAFPLASQSLKQWLIDSGVRAPVVELTARVTFYGQTDEGAQIETEASLAIALTNSGGGGTPPGTITTVYVKKTRDVSKAAAGTTGAFTVYRTGSFTSNLTINFTTSGTTTNAVDYTMNTPVVIPASSNNVEITVTPIPGGAVGTVIITLVDSASYTVVAPSNATVTITL